MTIENELSFMRKVLSFFAKKDVTSSLMFYPREDGSIRFSVICSDLFWWACADDEEITPENFPLLVQSVEDCQKIDPDSEDHGLSLFVCRIRKMRPQGACYPNNKDLWKLFDACGPERVLELGNPLAPKM